MSKNRYHDTGSVWYGIAAAIVTIAVFATPASAQSYPEGMVSYWRFEEGSGSIAYDSLNGNDATILGASWTTGRVGGGLSFDGVNDYLYLLDITGVGGSGSITLEAWASFRSGFSEPANGRAVVGVGNTTIGAHFFIRGFNDPDWIFAQCYGGPSRITIGADDGGADMWHCSGAETQTGIWYHIVATYDHLTQEVRLYVNGALTKISHLSQPLNLGSELFIGIDDYFDSWMDGIIDEVAIYSRVLTPEEILQHFQHGHYMDMSFGELSFTKVEIMFRPSINDDGYQLMGRFVLAETSDGIDPVNEDLTVEVGSSTVTIVAGSFVELASGVYHFSGPADDADVLVKIKAIDTSTFTFNIRTRGVDLSGSANPTVISLLIGNDHRSDELRLKGKLIHHHGSPKQYGDSD